MLFHRHVASLLTVLSSAQGNCVRAVLARMHDDGVAQAMSFLSLDPRCSRTVSAASPRMRLDAEALVTHTAAENEYGGVGVAQQGFVYSVRARKAQWGYAALAHAMWWADRCGLPLQLDVNNNRSDVLTLLDGCRRDRVTELSIRLTTTAICLGGTHGRSGHPSGGCGGRCRSFLCALATFSRVARISIDCRAMADEALMAKGVQAALRTVALQLVTEMRLCHCWYLIDFTALTGAANLRQLTATEGGLASVRDLASCTALTVLDVSHNHLLRSLSDLAGAPHLTTLTAQCCALANTDGLNCCPRLASVDLSHNNLLRDLTGLLNAPRLHTLAAHHCNLRDVDALHACHSLTFVDVSSNPALTSLAGLSKLRSLRKVAVSDDAGALKFDLGPFVTLVLL